MRRRTRPGGDAPPTSTALGSLLAGAGLLCSDFPQRAENLAALRALVPHWQRFFAECGLDGQPVLQWGDALDEMRADRAVLASATAAYHGLFNHPDPPVPLWESLWLSREKILFTECTDQVRFWYRAYGFTIPAHEAEDFLGYEMAFAGALFDKAHSTAAQDKTEQDPLEPFRRFLDTHLLRWGPDCVHNLEKATDNRFWRALFALCHEVLSGLRDPHL